MWHETVRSRIAAFHQSESIAADKFLTLARAMADGREAADLPLLVSAYLSGAGSYFDHLHHMARAELDRVAHRQGALPEGGSLFDGSRGVSRDVVAALCPELLPSLYQPRPNAGLEEILLLEPSPNELADNGFPAPMNMLLHRTQRPPLYAYATPDASVYAHPYRYQVLSRDRTGMWVSGSPRALSREAIGATELIDFDKDIVVLQDRFDFTAISHFLFDGIARALLLNQALGTLRSSVLLFGGVPGEYQDAVCQALCDTLGLSSDNIYFPDHPVILETSGRCLWFSDQVDGYIHPAQMAHPGSIRLLRTIVEALPGEPCEARRIYLSRSDAGHPHATNEDRLVAALEARGFASVLVDTMTVAEQTGLFRGAEVIVGPHGTDLTHLIAADRLKGIVELFPTRAGTDTYAFMARAGRIAHHCVVGTAEAGGFAIDVEQVCRYVDSIDQNREAPTWRKPANLIGGSRSFYGFGGVQQEPDGDPSVLPLIWGNAVFAHRLSEEQLGAAGLDAVLIGRFPAVRVIPGLRYTASCWVWIPEHFAGTEVLLGLGGGAICAMVAADLTRRQVWQRIVTTAVPAAAHSDVELRLFSPAPSALCSTCWQLERGSTPTTYVGTP